MFIIGRGGVGGGAVVWVGGMGYNMITVGNSS